MSQPITPILDRCSPVEDVVDAAFAAVLNAKGKSDRIPALVWWFVAESLRANGEGNPAESDLFAQLALEELDADAGGGLRPLPVPTPRPSPEEDRTSLATLLLAPGPTAAATLRRAIVRHRRALAESRVAPAARQRSVRSVST